MVSIGEIVRGERKRRGWNQAQLSEQAGISQGEVSRIERGERANPSLSTLVALETALGIPLLQQASRHATPLPVTSAESGFGQLQSLAVWDRQSPQDKAELAIMAKREPWCEASLMAWMLFIEALEAARRRQP